MPIELRENLTKGELGHHQDLRLDNRHQILFLAKRRVARQAWAICFDAIGGGGTCQRR